MPEDDKLETPMDSEALAAQLYKINERLIADQKTRHEMNNRLAVTFSSALESVTSSNRDLTNTLAAMREMADQVKQLKFWAFGATGQNGVNSTVKSHAETLRTHARQLNIGIGIVAVLNGVGVTLLIYILTRLP